MDSLDGDTGPCPSRFSLEGPPLSSRALENKDEIRCMARVDICSVKVISYLALFLDVSIQRLIYSIQMYYCQFLELLGVDVSID